MSKHSQHDWLIAIANGEKLQATQTNSTNWVDVTGDEGLYLIVSAGTHTLRIKPKTIFVNGIELPAPMTKAPPNGTNYFVVDLISTCYYQDEWWFNTVEDQYALNNGLCHLTADAAISHAKAILKGVKGDAKK